MFLRVRTFVLENCSVLSCWRLQLHFCQIFFIDIEMHFKHALEVCQLRFLKNFITLTETFMRKSFPVICNFYQAAHKNHQKFVVIQVLMFCRLHKATSTILKANKLLLQSRTLKICKKIFKISDQIRLKTEFSK